MTILTKEEILKTIDGFRQKIVDGGADAVEAQTVLLAVGGREKTVVFTDGDFISTAVAINNITDEVENALSTDEQKEAFKAFQAVRGLDISGEVIK